MKYRLPPTVTLAGCVAGAGLLALVATDSPTVPTPQQPAPAVQPAPRQPDIAPAPQPRPPPPQPKPCPHWGRPVYLAVGQVKDDYEAGVVHDGPTHEGVEVTCDLPADVLKRNIAASGLGCCVFRSLNYAALWQNVPALVDMPEWMVKSGIEGGGYPSKVDKLIPRIAKDRGLPVPEYVQHEGGDMAFLDAAIKSGRMPAITYGSAHMCSLVHLSSKWAVVRDNNFVGPNELYWMDRETFYRKWGGKSGWAVVLLAPRPPAPPRGGAHRHELASDEGPAVLALTAPLLPGAHEWRGWDSEPDQWALWRDGAQIGGYTAAGDYYREFNGNVWGKRWRRPPVALPPAAWERLRHAVPGGVVQAGLSHRECWSISGRPCSREEALAAIGADIPDDSAKLSLTAIGSPEETARVKADLDSPAFSSWKPGVLWQAYSPSDWAMRPGFVASGHPTVYLQRPDGTVLYRTDACDGPAALGALRKADPGYKPDSDPGPNRHPDISPDLSGAPDAHLCAGCVALGITVLSLAARKLRSRP